MRKCSELKPCGQKERKRDFLEQLGGEIGAKEAPGRARVRPTGEPLVQCCQVWESPLNDISGGIASH
jgi:hypothetical protein